MTAMSEPIRARSAAGAPTPSAVIVTDAHHPVAIPFIRSLARAGWRVIVAGPERSSLGFRSRHAAHRLVYPSPRRDPRGFVGTLARVARREGARLVIPLSDGPIEALDAERDALPDGCRVAIPESAALAVAMDKRLTIELAERLGVPVPPTTFAHSPRDVMTQASELRAPYALKLARGSHRMGTLYALDPEDAGREAARLINGDTVLVQEFVSGVGVGVELLMDEGRVLLAFQHRRLREVPVTGGASALRESVPLDPVLYEDARRLMAELRWTGLAMIEFRVGPEGHRLMEINGRAWGSLPLAQAAGVDFPLGLAWLYSGTRPTRSPVDAGQLGVYRLGVRSRNLTLEALWILSVLLRRPPIRLEAWPARREALRALVQLLDPRIRFDVLSRHDPAPGAAEVVRVARTLLGRLVRR